MINTITHSYNVRIGGKIVTQHTPGIFPMMRGSLVTVTRFNLVKTLKKLPGDNAFEKSLRNIKDPVRAAEAIRLHWEIFPSYIENLIPKQILNLIL